MKTNSFLQSGEAKDRSEQIDNISSAQGWTAWLETFPKKDRGVQELSSFRITSPTGPTFQTPLRKAVCEMLCTLVLKDLTAPELPDRLASESPSEKDFQQQILPREGMEEGSGKSCL